MMATLAGSRITIEHELHADPCFVNADPNQFDTALVNMVVNARDAMNGEGRIIVKVDAVTSMPAVRAHGRIDAPFVTVSITDDGSGIAPEAIERIFEPFFTTKGVGKGTGLGLSQVFGFAKQSGGEIMLASTVGEGSTFTLYLPEVAAPAPTDPAGGQEEPDALPAGHGLRILLVEDNNEVRGFASRTLEELGFVVTSASSGDEGLKAVALADARFDAIFSDVVMPGMSGIEMAERIRRDDPDTPIVLASGYSHVLAKNSDHGFELLHKPYSVDQLSRILRRALVH